MHDKRFCSPHVYCKHKCWLEGDCENRLLESEKTNSARVPRPWLRPPFWHPPLANCHALSELCLGVDELKRKMVGQWVKSIDGIGIVPVWVTSKEPNKRKQNQTPKNPTQFKNSSKETQKTTWQKHIMHTQRTKQEKVFILSRLHLRRSTSARVLTAGHAMLRAMKEIYPLNPDPLGLRAFGIFE